MKMWRRAVCAALVCLALLSILVPTFAYTVPSDTVVYVTDTGSKYHRDGCSYLKSKNKMTIQEAEQEGYGPCSRCDPDEETGKYYSKSSGHASGGAERRDATKETTAANVATKKGFPVLVTTITVALVALCFFSQLMKGGGIGVFKSVQRRKKKKGYMALYSGLEPEALVEMPPGTEIGADGLPKVKGAKGWGAAYTCYITPNGEIYHGTKGCSGARKEVHICQVMGVKKPCAKCHPPTEEDLSWYAEYIRVKEIKRKYKIP